MTNSGLEIALNEPIPYQIFIMTKFYIDENIVIKKPTGSLDKNLSFTDVQLHLAHDSYCVHFWGLRWQKRTITFIFGG